MSIANTFDRMYSKDQMSADCYVPEGLNFITASEQGGLVCNTDKMLCETGFPDLNHHCEYGQHRIILHPNVKHCILSCISVAFLTSYRKVN